MKNKKIQKLLFTVLSVAFLALNGLFLFPQGAKAQELFGGRADCYYTWNTSGFNESSFIKCDGCTRIEAYNPSDDRRCRPTPE